MRAIVGVAVVASMLGAPMLIGAIRPAEAQTVYADYPSWRAAMPAGDVIGPYPELVILTESIFVSTALGNCMFHVGSAGTQVSQVSFTGFDVAPMSFPGDCGEGPGAVDYDIGSATVTLPTPVDGVFGDFETGPDTVMLSSGDTFGQLSQWGEWGIGPTSEITFSVADVGTDNGDFLYLSNIVVAMPPIPEPSSLLVLLTGTLAMSLRRSRRRGSWPAVMP